ncbi:MAG: Glu/Leu/Phe/Val dehydrogenase [Candidatus Eisenbacteria bacterium]
MSSGNLNPFAIALQRLGEAAERLGLDEATHEFLRWPMREITVTLPVKMDDGGVRFFRGHRVQYNTARGPAKGGLRWHPDETIQEIRALAARMTWKTAVMDLPLGGGQGGVACNPKEMTEGEKERLARAYIRQVGCVLGTDKDVAGPDIYTTPPIMAWMMDEHETIHGGFDPGVITGKPIPLGGSRGRGDAAARGGIFCVREAAAARGIDLKGSTAAIQGFGNAGQFAATLGEELLGLKIVAATDSRGGVFHPEGMDAERLVNHKLTTGRVEGFPGAKPIGSEEALELDVDVLFPSALENVITKENAPRVKAKIVCELAHGPTTPEADGILHGKGVFLLPDFLANAGGVTVSYFEQVQNAYNYYWSLEEVHRRLDEKMTRAFRDVYEMHEMENVPMRLAASMVAVSRVAEACRLRGWA